MKKLILFFLATFIAAISCFAQRDRIVYEDSITCDITGTDTVVYLPAKRSGLFVTYGYGSAFSAQFDYYDFDANDAVLDIGGVNWIGTFDSWGGDDLPHTMNVGSDSTDVNGVSGGMKATAGFTRNGQYFEYLPIKLTPGSVSSDKYLKYKIIVVLEKD